MRILSLILSLVVMACSYKIVIFTPDFSNSQLLFNTRVGETLAKAGHNVTMVLIRSIEDKEREAKKKDVKIMKEINVRVVNATGTDTSELQKIITVLLWESSSMFDKRHNMVMQKFLDVLIGSCDVTLKDTDFINWLPAQKFDIAFVHSYHACPIGLVHVGKIPSWVWLNSGPLMDNVASLLGVPSIPSYVPPVMMESTDKMNFLQRAKSLIGHIAFSVMWPRMVANRETEIFRKHFGSDFPDLIDLAKQCPLVMANSNELYEFPRPTLAKVVNIGGLGVEFKNAKPLNKEFSDVATAGKGTIVMSFGSVAQAHLMPLYWKNSILAAFRRFPDYQFILRYEDTDLNDRLPPNVHLTKWMPQADLLKHPNTKAFISHGGYNSLQESITAGVPLITIPLHGDQPKNAKLAESHGFSINIMKSELSEETIYRAIQEVLSNSKYTEKAKHLSAMVQNQPVTPEHLLVKWTEFLAKFKRLHNLVPAGQDLNIIQYFSLDVIFVTLALALSILYLCYRTLRWLSLLIYSRIMRKKKNE